MSEWVHAKCVSQCINSSSNTAQQCECSQPFSMQNTQRRRTTHNHTIVPLYSCVLFCAVLAMEPNTPTAQYMDGLDVYVNVTSWKYLKTNIYYF
jgi:hypothetical protein